ncbi:MAG: DUF7706 family protein [Planctomycetota bacterium]
MSRQVSITIELDANEAHELYLLTKRLTFEDALAHTDAGRTKDQRTDQAYVMVRAVEKITDALLERSATGGA